MSWDKFNRWSAAWWKRTIETDLSERTKKLIGSASPLRGDHPEFGLALRLFKWDRACLAKFKKRGPKKSSK